MLRLRPILSSKFLQIRNLSITPTAKQNAPPKFDETLSVKQRIHKQIELSGPISIATYMQQANTGEDRQGYYMSRDPLGEQGDFITSPEISQLFGEMVGTWCVHEFMCNKVSEKADCPLHLIELGPGKGTMMSDILRITDYLRKYLGEKRKIKVSMVEISDTLIAKQKETLEKWISDENENVEINWYKAMDEIELDETVPEYILAHEFFDALPIYKLKKMDRDEKVRVSKTEDGGVIDLDGEKLREIMIDVDPKNYGEFRYVVAQNATPVSKLSEQIFNTDPTSLLKRGFDEFEVSFQGAAIFSYLSTRIAATSGCGLIMDYGYAHEKMPGQNSKQLDEESSIQDLQQKQTVYGRADTNKIIDTFRGYKNHKQHDVLQDSGNVDLTADVDFDFLAKSILSSDYLYENIRLAGPLTQRVFLKNMGIDARLNNLLIEQKGNDDIRKKIVTGYEYITDNEMMGEKFKFVAITTKERGEYVDLPVTGFHSNVDPTKEGKNFEKDDV